MHSYSFRIFDIFKEQILSFKSSPQYCSFLQRDSFTGDQAPVTQWVNHLPADLAVPSLGAMVEWLEQLGYGAESRRIA